jgi:hypothetical protein
MKLALYLSSLGFNGIWFASGKDQLGQPKKYLKFIIEQSYLKYLISELLKESVIFKNQGDLILKNLTELNARSARADFIVYDEEAQSDEDAYNAAVNILAGSPLGLILHISTPAKATIFEIKHDRLKLREINTGDQFIFSRRWDEIERFINNRDWYEEQQRILPGWYFRQEHECSFELALGAVFINVEYGSYPEWLTEDISYCHLCSGVDFNPVGGHWLVSVKWTRDFRNVVVVEEHDIGQGYAVDLNAEQFYIIAQHGSLGNHITLEDGGINEEYIKWFYKMLSETRFGFQNQNFHKEEWDNQGLNKLKTVTHIIQHGITIYVDKVRFPTLAKMIEDCQWDPDATEPKLKKDPANSPHALDAFLHAISSKNLAGETVEVGKFY